MLPSVMGLMGTVVSTWEMLEPLVWLLVVGGLFTAAVWCVWRWRRRRWGWPLAMALLAVDAALVERLRREWGESRALNREMQTEFDLMQLRSELRQLRMSTPEMQAMDAEGLVRTMLADGRSGFRRRVNGAGEIVDRWERALRIEVGPGLGEVMVSSAGGDGRFGTADDLPREE